MHIHSYQIHNVLNVYRQQLSRGSVRKFSGGPEVKKAFQERRKIADQVKRQTVFEKISSEIVQRITQFGPDTRIEAALSGQTAKTRGSAREHVDAAAGKNPVFSYTLIDKNNQKTTHSLSIRQLNHSTHPIDSQIKAASDTDTDTDPGSE